MESYSVEAILSAVDKNFSSTMKNADSSMNNLDSSTQKTNTSIFDIAKGIGVFKLVDSAIGLVKSSMDGAIDRFDTLNKYPVVMQALGYSAEEVDKSMNKLTDGIDGLPTSLDEIVSSAQQLAISTGDLQKGTDTAVALNNAFLASGASAADASRGAQQYQQMLSKGEVDLQSWRSLLETMPIAMDKVSKSFSDQGVNSANDLYAALKKGDITFDDFNSRLIELNEGVGGFAELAQKNSAGIRTSFANIKTAVVKGLANVITAIDEGMQDAGLGSIAENFDKIKGAVNVAFKAITDSIPPAISFLTNLWNTIKPFLPLIMAVVGYISIYQGVMGTARKAVELYNGAQKMMNVLMNLNPIGLIIAAVIALVAAFIYFWKTSEEFRNFWIGLWESIKATFSTAWETMKNSLLAVWDAIIALLMPIVVSVMEIFSPMITFFIGLWEQIKTIAGAAWELIKAVIMAPILLLIDLVTGDFNRFKEDLSMIWTTIKDSMSTIVLAVVKIVIGYFKAIFDTGKNIFNGLKDFFSGIWGSIKETASNAWQSIKDTASRIWGEMVDGVSNLVNDIFGWFDKIKDIDLLEAGRAIIDGFLKGLKEKYEGVKDFIGGIGDWIRDHKGPIRVDKKLLIPAGNAIMEGLNNGLDNGFGAVQDNVSSMGDRLSTNFDIGSRLTSINSQIQTKVQHEVSYGTNNKPAMFNIQLGNQVFQAFVEDINEAQGNGINVNMQF
ncbi:tape measure protein [Enterococcus casseliflavus]|uniref:tape measure protein n=2 Tax=Bacteria TaxID=2 RepID=UPI00115EA5F9|nr:tape measure protein [Enterococcus casseliflavus]